MSSTDRYWVLFAAAFGATLSHAEWGACIFVMLLLGAMTLGTAWIDHKANEQIGN